MQEARETAREVRAGGPIDLSLVDDQTLVACVVADERGAWDELRRRYDDTINKRIRSVIGNCSRLYRSSDLFDEIQARTFAELFANNRKRLRRFDGRTATLGGWLSLIAGQSAIKHLTRVVLRHGAPDPIEAVIESEDRDRGGDAQRGARWVACGL
jgi:hypothetical protein